MIISTNPAKNYEVIDSVESSTKEQVNQAVASARKAQNAWRELGLVGRTAVLKKVKEVFQAHEAEIAKLITEEIGMAYAESLDEVSWDWGYWDWFINNAETILKPSVTLEDATSIHMQYYESLGVAAVITPWNLPFDMFVWGVIPNLLVGNTVVYKASEECALSGAFYEKIMKEAKLPEGVCNFIHGDSSQGAWLVNENIDLIWFTGSSEVGQILYKKAGEKFIKAVLEMGGSNPVVIFDDADVDKLINTIAFKRFSFCGQTCDAMKRLIVHESRYEEVVAKLSEKMKAIVVGDPSDLKTQMGSLASKQQKDILESQVQDALQQNAKVIARTTLNKSLSGAYYPPTILGNIKPEMRVWKEEVFGPVLPVVTFKTDAEALNLANNTKYGLSAQIYTKDTSRIQKMREGLVVGSVDINGASHFKPQNPFGGCKLSGIGREHGEEGLRELTKIKVVSQAK